MISSINHLSFTVSDLDRSVNFYQNVLGLSLTNVSERDPAFSEKVTGIAGAHLRIAYLKTSNASLELIQYLAPPGEKLDTRTNNVGSSHVCFNVRNFNELIERLKMNEVKFSGDPQVIPAGPNRGKQVVYFKDPDSNNIEFISEETIG